MNNRYSEIHANDVVISCSRDALYSQNKIFDIKTFGPTLHVKIDINVHKSYRVMRIYNIDTSDSVSRYDYDELEHPWVDIPIDCIDLNAGLHTYALEFINLVTGDTFYQYFNYTIQDDKPAKPYIYMNR